MKILRGAAVAAAVAAMSVACGGGNDDLDRSRPEDWEVVSEGELDGPPPDLGVGQARIEELQPPSTMTSMDQTAEFDMLEGVAPEGVPPLPPARSAGDPSGQLRPPTYRPGSRTPGSYSAPSSSPSRPTSSSAETRSAASSERSSTTGRTTTVSPTSTQLPTGSSIRERRETERREAERREADRRERESTTTRSSERERQEEPEASSRERSRSEEPREEEDPPEEGDADDHA